MIYNKRYKLCVSNFRPSAQIENKNQILEILLILKKISACNTKIETNNL